ncbi:hypothetical protein BUALT_Bualt04G0046600 [Buddleja alternifolia]|uniref:H15 domain-containing protein n=1 Tax=Buddleja alternifolia TaxID=168488 RepID=A0AAV6XX77_9LAMI|nr:hypothetical protein BUALT_Bualt04G0046600 [Buddleja alternifolia]
MSTTSEVQKPKASKPAAAKEKKPKEKKMKKTTKTASHPPYFEMIKEAVLALDEKSGSSPYAIAKYMEEKHKSALPSNFRKTLSLQLKNCATKGKLIKIKASYKLSQAAKKDKPATATKRKAAESLKKKGTPAKKPKTIKSPAPKKAKKTA